MNLQKFKKEIVSDILKLNYSEIYAKKFSDESIMYRIHFTKIGVFNPLMLREFFNIFSSYDFIKMETMFKSNLVEEKKQNIPTTITKNGEFINEIDTDIIGSEWTKIGIKETMIYHDFSGFITFRFTSEEINSFNSNNPVFSNSLLKIWSEKKEKEEN